MTVIQNKLVEKVVRELNAINAQFKIIMPDGDEYGLLEIKPVPKRNAFVKIGTYRDVYKDVVENICVGDVAEIDFLKVKGSCEGLRSSIAAAMHTKYGSGAHSTYINRASGKIELIRIK